LDTLTASPWPSSRALAQSTDRCPFNASPTAAERVIASELQSRGQGCDALSMMVSSMARMVQAGRSTDNRWKAG
jgi:hypothetical protein